MLLLVSAFLVLGGDPVRRGDRHPPDGSGPPSTLPSGLLYLIAVSSMSTLGIFLAGWSSRNKYSLLGAMRAVAQLVSYEVPAGAGHRPDRPLGGEPEPGGTIFQPAARVRLVHLLAAGAAGFVRDPDLIANIAEVNRTPFDLPEAESEIIAGYHTEYSGMRFGLFFLAEYLSVFGVSCLGTLLFLGGGSLPFLVEFPGASHRKPPAVFVLVNSITVGVFFLKVALLRLPDVLGPGHLAPDAGRPADGVRLEVPGPALASSIS